MMKILILILTFSGTLLTRTPSAWAIGMSGDFRGSYADDARDMLRSETEENENTDAASRWGQSIRNRNQQEYKRVTRVDPISETSFAQESSRAPASVGNRGPAAMPEQQPLRTAAASGAPHSAVVRAVNKQKAYQESAVIANDQGFFPSTVFVTQGIPVRLFVTGASAKSQCFVMDSFGVRRQIKSQKIEEISFTPETSGTYVFTCPMNGARGQVVVREIDVGGRIPASESQVSRNNNNE